MGFSEGCTGVAQAAHRGCAGGAEGAHREHAVPILPNFFAFQAREMKFGEQNGIMTSESFQIFGGTRSFTNSLWHTVISNFLWHAVIYKYPVARGHFKLRINHFSKKMFSKWVSGWAFIFKMCFCFHNVKGCESFFFHFSEKNCLGSFMYRGS